jgi:formylglycine-generating enzyme required for sulfatase activity
VCLALGCGEANARPQLLVVLETDVPVSGQALGSETVSVDASIDTVRVDVFDASGTTIIESRRIAAPEASNWPLSFGIVRPDGVATKAARLRLRAFRSTFARPGEINGEPTLDPMGEVTIDRLVELPYPLDAPHTARIVLRGDCIGVPSTFQPAWSTCVDATRKQAVPTTTDDAQTGTWAAATARDCAGQIQDGRICIPGGFTVLGEPVLYGLADEGTLETLPLVPVVVSPFWVDKTEYTVGRLRSLVAQGRAPAGAVDAIAALSAGATECAWAAVSDGALPLNCVAWQTAQDLCRADGGDLTSEAQWEHMARGRGQRRFFPWGDSYPQCCTASLSRKAHGGGAPKCAGSGMEPVGSHTQAAACGGTADVSRDGVLDLGGSVAEYQLDGFRPYSDACWGGPGVRNDPVCATTGAGRMLRGGDWSGGDAWALSPLRRLASSGAVNGFRCAYPDGAR